MSLNIMGDNGDVKFKQSTSCHNQLFTCQTCLSLSIMSNKTA